MKRFFKNILGETFEKILANQSRHDDKLDSLIKSVSIIETKLSFLEKRLDQKELVDHQTYGHIQYKLQEISNDKKAS
jgi:hypothetical protein